DVDHRDFEERHPGVGVAQGGEHCGTPASNDVGVLTLRRQHYPALSRGLHLACDNLTASLQGYSRGRAFWERDGERVAEAVCILGERDLCVVQLRDLLDDRKPKTTAVGMT